MYATTAASPWRLSHVTEARDDEQEAWHDGTRQVCREGNKLQPCWCIHGRLRMKINFTVQLLYRQSYTEKNGCMCNVELLDHPTAFKLTLRLLSADGDGT